MSSPNKKSAFFYGDDMGVIGAKLCIAVAADSVQRCISSDVSHEQTGTSASSKKRFFRRSHRPRPQEDWRRWSHYHGRRLFTFESMGIRGS